MDEIYKGDDEINRENSPLQDVDDSFLTTLKNMTHTINMNDISSEYLLDSGIIAFSFEVFQQQDIEDQIFLTQLYYKLINHSRHIFLTLFLNQTFFSTLPYMLEHHYQTGLRIILSLLEKSDAITDTLISQINKLEIPLRKHNDIYTIEERHLLIEVCTKIIIESHERTSFYTKGIYNKIETIFTDLSEDPDFLIVLLFQFFYLILCQIFFALVHFLVKFI